MRDAHGACLTPMNVNELLRIAVESGASDLHLKAKLRITREQCLEAAIDAVRRDASQAAA